MYYSSTYYKCFYVEWYLWDYDTNTVSSTTYLPFSSGGLTKTMADARNPKGETAYRIDSGTTYYIMEYKNMKVCACVYACGLNGFKYAMLWNQ